MMSTLETPAGIEFRIGREHERVALMRSMHRGFGGHYQPDEGELEYEKTTWDPLSSAVLAFDDDELVGTSAGYDFRITIPSGPSKFLGVTEVTVASTHRRRGILRAMMQRLLRKGLDEGHHIAGLWASESNIYGRFGFGISGETQVAKLDTRHGQFRKEHDLQGELRFASLGMMRQAAPKIWEKSAAQTTGMIKRREGEWDWRYNPQRIKNIKPRKPFFVIYSENGVPLGYVEYSIEDRQRGMHSANLVRVRELIAATATAETALWRYVLDIDLASEIYDGHHPKKSSLLWLLTDPRKLSFEPYDSMWIRILDPLKALSARTYSASGEIAIEVTDDFCPWTNGVYLLTVDDNGVGTCDRTDRLPDVTMPIASIGSIYMGAHYLADLQRAGRVTEHKSGSIAQIDTMFPISGVHNFVPEF